MPIYNMQYSNKCSKKDTITNLKTKKFIEVKFSRGLHRNY